MLDKIQATIHKNFSSEMWLGKQKHIERAIEWNTLFKRNIPLFATMYLGLSLHLYQTILLYLMGVCSQFVLVAARASAKSYLIAIYTCCRAILYPGSRIVVASSTKGQAKLIVSEKIRSELMNASPNLRREIKSIKDNQNEVIVFFKNGSTITVVVANENARGHRATLMVYEEFRQILKHIIDSILGPFLFVRQPPYMKNPEYSDIKELREEPQEVYISSSWMRSHWMWDTMKVATKDMLKDKSAYLIGMDYSITLKHNIRTRRQLVREKKKLDPMSWAIEYENLMPSENTRAYFSYGMLSGRQTLKKAFYPRRFGEPPKSKLKYSIPRQDGEVRVVSCDIAMMDGNMNDNSAYACLRLLPETVYSEEEHTNKFGYRIQMPYIEANHGKETLKQVIRIKQLMYDFEADYLVLDTRNAGLSLYDMGARVLYDEERGIEYRPWLCMNNPDIARRINSNVDEPNVYCVIASQRLNSDIAINLRQLLVDGKLDLLINAGDAVEEMQTHIPEYSTSEAETQLFFESPYLETMLVINETANLEYDKLEQTGAIRIREQGSAVKDRYTALSYGCYFASELERDLLQEDDSDFSSIPHCVNLVTFD